MAAADRPATDAGAQSLIILESLLCLLREKNVLNRADLEELGQRMKMRAAAAVDDPLPCCPKSAAAASEDMERMTDYLGQRYGGKHARTLR